MDSLLNITSFNCKNVKTSAQDVRQLCEKNDIILLQETWLPDFDLQFLTGIHQEFFASGISSMDSSAGLLPGRPHGGMAILWRRSLADSCKIVKYDDPRMIGIVINTHTCQLLIVNVYMPYSCSSNIDEYLECLSNVHNIMYNFPSPYTYAIGDFNSDTIDDHRQIFGREFLNFCVAEGYMVSDKSLLNPHSFTFYSSAHATVSWIDHVVTSTSGHEIIKDVNIDYSILSSDHFPVTVTLDVDKISVNDETGKRSECKRIKWDKVSDSDLNKYTNNTKLYSGQINFQRDLVQCNDVNCEDHSHKTAISNLYEDLIKVLTRASTHLETNNRKYRKVPGWDTYCKEIHSIAREHFLEWIANGRPRQGVFFDNMKVSRANFKRVIRDCLDKESTANCDLLAKHYLAKDTKQFWTKIRSMTKVRDLLSNNVDNIIGEQNIAEHWKGKFEGLLNSDHSTNHKSNVESRIRNENLQVHDKPFSMHEVEQCVNKLKIGKAAGIDGTASEHYKYSDKRIFYHISNLMNACVTHNFFPRDMMKTILVPIVKDKNESLSSSDNYRPIAITSVMSKIYELLLLRRAEGMLITTSNQFGFKPQHSTDMAVYSLKCITEYYTTQNSPVYICFVDASKAFDRVNHWTLYIKLLERGVPTILVRSLAYWYCNQTFLIRWGSALSAPFSVTNGLRQGGILSPHLYNVYIDELSCILGKSHAGCYLNDVCMNHFVYADDTVILAPSAQGLQDLLHLCENYASVHNIIFNVKKTRCMCVKPKALKDMCVPNIKLNEANVIFVREHKYLGCMLTDNMNDDKDINRQIRQVYIRGNSLVNKFKACTENVKAELFRVYCVNMYCCALWANYSVSARNRLTVAYKSIFRRLYNISTRDGSTTGFMLEQNCDPLDVVLRKSIYSFRNRLLKADNSIINVICNSTFYLDSSNTKEWTKVLYRLHS